MITENKETRLTLSDVRKTCRNDTEKQMCNSFVIRKYVPIVMFLIEQFTRDSTLGFRTLKYRYAKPL